MLKMKGYLIDSNREKEIFTGLFAQKHLRSQRKDAQRGFVSIIQVGSQNLISLSVNLNSWQMST